MILAHPSRAEVGSRRRVYASAARHAYRQWLIMQRDGRDAVLLLPSYIGQSPLEGSGLYDPVRETGTPVVFYRVGPTLEADLDHVRELLDRHVVFGLVHIHYFGFPDPGTRAIERLCQQRGVSLLADCCHGLGLTLNERPIDEGADYTLVSLHKLFACRHGGFLEAHGGAPLPMPPEEHIDLEDLSTFTDVRMTDHRRDRRSNYTRLAGAVHQLDGVRLLHAELPPGAIPLNVPVEVMVEDRYEVYKRMRSRGVEVIALYHTLIDPLSDGPFENAKALSRRILNLPCHPELGDLELEAIVSALANSLQSP